MNLKYKVLCIGVNEVPGLTKLAYAEDDAQTTAKYFETLKDKTHVTLLTGKNGTRKNIIHWVRECNQIQKELSIIIFFAGHGSAREDKRKKRLERCLWIDSNEGGKLESHQLKTSEILEILNNPLHNLIFIIDACYEFKRKFIPMQTIFEQFKESERMTELKRYVIISASSVSRAAFEDSRLKHGVLTYYFLHTISGKYSFFLRKKIPAFKFLAALSKKVRTHRVLTNTGRKVPLDLLMENVLMVHYVDDKLELPVLEPVPSVSTAGKSVFRQKISQWALFFKRTRLRNTFRFIWRILAAALLFLALMHLTIVRIHFAPMKYTKFYNFLLGYPALYLNDLGAERLGLDYEKSVTLYLFKHNWVKALLAKLDEKGKIILSGNFLGDRIRGVDKTQILEFALDQVNRKNIFYWHPGDVNRLLKIIGQEYGNFDWDRKKAVLTLLSELGKKGTSTAVQIFDFKKETSQELRNLFLEHFYSFNFWEKNFDYFNHNDYRFLIGFKTQVPSLNNIRPGKEAEDYLHAVARSLPDSHTRTIETDTLPGIYVKLGVLAYFGSPWFQQKASVVFKKAFDPEECLNLFRACRNLNDKLWVQEQFARDKQHMNEITTHWYQLIYDLLPQLPVKEKSKIVKVIIDNKFHLVPEIFKKHFAWYLRDFDPGVIGLSDWGNWIKNQRISPYLTLLLILQMKYSHIFDFIETYYDYFKREFSVYLYETLFKQDNHKAVQLAKKRYPNNSGREKLACAVFLYNKTSGEEYSLYIANFLREAGSSQHKIEILKSFAGPEKFIPFIEKKGIARKHIRYLLEDRELFYGFFRLNLVLWPGEVTKMILDARIPYDSGEGIRLLRACEELPDLYRKTMLLKICSANIDKTFRLNAELSLQKNYPVEFLKLAYTRRYHLDQFKWVDIVKTYQSFSYETLKAKILSGLRRGMYGEIDWICEALIRNEAKGKLTLKQLRDILSEFDRPVERMLLRRLRHYVHKCYFQEAK